MGLSVFRARAPAPAPARARLSFCPLTPELAFRRGSLLLVLGPSSRYVWMLASSHDPPIVPDDEVLPNARAVTQLPRRLELAASELASAANDAVVLNVHRTGRRTIFQRHS